jgi:diaminohydroxyphosphoribosylaminopyrimidine deaminase/5-amino-6-(5-phosphoribosylamino)uracil reductase
VNQKLSELKKNQSINLNQACALSLDLAEQALGRVEPNPCVGAVLINEAENTLVSWGHHEFFGGPHAEVNCLKDIESAKGLTLVVSLEPCSHFGKTPPCADLVIEKKVSKLIYIESDPNPAVSGKGLERIKAAGIKVSQAPVEFQKRHGDLNEKFLYSFKNKHSYVHLKWAQSANAKLGYKDSRTQITSLESQLDSHFLRAQSQMILVGLETILQDDPKLNIRLTGYEKDLKVAVVDPDLVLAGKLETKAIQKIRSQSDIFLVSDKQNTHSNVIQVKKTAEGQLDLSELREKTFKDYGVQSIFVEGGAFTHKSFIDQGVFNRISVYESSKSLEHANSLSVFESKAKQDDFLSYKMRPVQERKIGDDLFKDFLRKSN